MQRALRGTDGTCVCVCVCVCVFANYDHAPTHQHPQHYFMEHGTHLTLRGTLQLVVYMSGFLGHHMPPQTPAKTNPPKQQHFTSNARALLEQNKVLHEELQHTKQRMGCAEEACRALEGHVAALQQQVHQRDIALQKLQAQVEA